MRSQPVGMAVRNGGDDQLVGVGDALQRLELMGDLIGISDELRCGAVLHDCRLLVGQRSTVSGSG